MRQQFLFDFHEILHSGSGPKSKIEFSYPLSFRTLDWGDPYGIFWKSVTDPETIESLRQPMVKI